MLVSLLFSFALVLPDGVDARFEGALWLHALVLGLYMSIECGVGEIPLAASALEIPALLILPAPP